MKLLKKFLNSNSEWIHLTNKPIKSKMILSMFIMNWLMWVLKFRYFKIFLNHHLLLLNKLSYNKLSSNINNKNKILDREGLLWVIEFKSNNFSRMTYKISYQKKNCFLIPEVVLFRNLWKAKKFRPQEM